MFEDKVSERLSVVSALDPSSSARARIPCRGRALRRDAVNVDESLHDGTDEKDYIEK